MFSQVCFLGDPNPNASSFEAQSRLNFTAIMLQHKNVGFHLKSKSKNDNQARKRGKDSSINDESNQAKAEEKQRGKVIYEASLIEES